MIYWELFITFFKIGIFTFGGGYAMIPLIQNEVIVNHEWIDAPTFTDIIAISQMTPGPIGINSATYIGYTVTGNIWGSLLATFAVTLPSFIIILTISCFYIRFKQDKWLAAALSGIRPVVIGLIAAAAVLLITPENFIDWRSWILFAVAFIAVFLGKQHPIAIIVAAGVAGVIIF